MTGCNKNHKFVVISLGYIELREKDTGNFVRAVACKDCLPQLKIAIKKLEGMEK